MVSNVQSKWPQQVGTEKGGNTRSGSVGLSATPCSSWERHGRWRKTSAFAQEARREQLHATSTRQASGKREGGPSFSTAFSLPPPHLATDTRIFHTKKRDFSGCGHVCRSGGSGHEPGALGPKCRTRQMSPAAIVSEGFYKHNLIVLPQTLEAYCPA